MRSDFVTKRLGLTTDVVLLVKGSAALALLTTAERVEIRARPAKQTRSVQLALGS